MSDEFTSVPEPLITSDPARMGGTACFAGTRVPVQMLFDYLEDGAPLSEFLSSFPNISREHVVAVLGKLGTATIFPVEAVALDVCTQAGKMVAVPNFRQGGKSTGGVASGGGV